MLDLLTLSGVKIRCLKPKRLTAVSEGADQPIRFMPETVEIELGIGFKVEGEAGGLDKYRGFWTGAAQGDYDHDGNVYLCICGYVKALSCPLV
jgi:hypothetical protein